MTKLGIYQHYKTGSHYLVLGVLHDSTNGPTWSRTLVHYISLTTGMQLAREESEFHQRVWLTGFNQQQRPAGKPATIKGWKDVASLERATSPRFIYVGDKVQVGTLPRVPHVTIGDEGGAVALAKRAQGKKARSTRNRRAHSSATRRRSRRAL